MFVHHHARKWFAGVVGMVACGSVALAHNHVTVDTMPGTAPLFQPRAVIRAGYLPTEGTLSIVSGRLMRLGEVAAYDIPARLPETSGGELSGWAIGDDILLTSDYFFGTGRLDGGNFRFEIAGVTPVSGGQAALVWGSFDEFGTYGVQARSAGASRAERSFEVGIGGHDHFQAFAFGAAAGGSSGWVQDVTLIAWDANGVYADSDPVTVRLDNGECPADFSRTAGVTIDDLFMYMNAYFTGNTRADFDRENGVTIDDLFLYINAWFVGCL